MSVTATLSARSARGDGGESAKDTYTTNYGSGVEISCDITADRGTVFTRVTYDGGAKGTGTGDANDGMDGGAGGDGIGIFAGSTQIIALGGGGGGGGRCEDDNGVGGNGGQPSFGGSANGGDGGRGKGSGGLGGGGGTSSKRGAAGDNYKDGTPASATNASGGGKNTTGGNGGSVNDNGDKSRWSGGGGGGGGFYGGGGGGYHFDQDDSREGAGGGGGGRSFISSAASPITSYSSTSVGSSTAQSNFFSMNGYTISDSESYLLASASTLSNFTITVDKNTLMSSGVTIDFTNSAYNGFHNDALIISGDISIHSVQKMHSSGSGTNVSTTISNVKVSHVDDANSVSSSWQLSTTSSNIPSGTRLTLDETRFRTTPSSAYENNGEVYLSNQVTLTIVLTGDDPSGSPIDLSSNVLTTASTTNFITSAGDLNTIFQPISLGTAIDYNTGFEVSDNDLKNIFAKKTSAAGSATGFEVSGNDLNTIFEPLNLRQKLIVNTATSGNETIYLPSDKTMTVILVGGGGGGSTRVTSGTSFSAGNGGAGGQIVIQEITTAGSYSIDYSIGAGGTGSTTQNSAGGTGGTSTVTIGGTTYTASGGAGGNLGLDGVGSQGTAGDDYNYNHGGTAAVKYRSGGDTFIDGTDGQGGFVLTVDGTTYDVGGGGGGGKTYYTDKNEDETFGGIGGGDGEGTTEYGGTNGGGGGGGAANNNGVVGSGGGDGGAGFLCIVVNKISP